MEINTPNFEEDLRAAIIFALEGYHIHYKKSDDLHSLAVRLCEFEEKYIIPRPRNVHISKELADSLNTYPTATQEAVRRMAEWVEQGVDINCFQGRGLYGKGPRDYQNMIYGVIHLHLSAKKGEKAPVIKAGGFAKPSSYLLYAYFTVKSAYFIKVQEHPEAVKTGDPIPVEWISKEILVIMERNWPELLAAAKFENAYLCDENGAPITVDDKALATLSSHHINSAISIGENIYMAPNFGMTCSGNSLKAAMQANRLINDMRQAEMLYDQNREQIIEVFSDLLPRSFGLFPAVFDVHYVYHDSLERFVIFDRMFGAFYDWKGGKFGLFITKTNNER